MPNIILRIPKDCLTLQAKRVLVQGITGAAAEAEQIPDAPQARALCWVVIEETVLGNWGCGGSDMQEMLIPVMLQVFVPAGVTDSKARQRYAFGLAQAIKSALSNDTCSVAISTIFMDVADGYWGVDSQLWSLGDFAHHAQYRHLQAMAHG